MNRNTYYHFISERIQILSSTIKTNGKLNLLDINVQAEPFFRDLLNKMYAYKLSNANSSVANTEAIDLIDSESKIIIQVTSTNTKKKNRKYFIKRENQRMVGEGI